MSQIQTPSSTLPFRSLRLAADAARALHRGCQRGDPDALRRFIAHRRDALAEPSLQRCQHVVAREAGCAHWAELAGLLGRARVRPLASGIDINDVALWCATRGVTPDMRTASRIMEIVARRHRAGALPTIDAAVAEDGVVVAPWHLPRGVDDGRPTLALGHGVHLRGIIEADDIRRLCLGCTEQDPYIIDVVLNAIRRLRTGTTLEALKLALRVDPALTAMGAEPFGMPFARWTREDDTHGVWMNHPLLSPWTIEGRHDGGIRQPRSILVTGGVGSGKSVWLRRFLTAMRPAVRRIRVWDAIGDGYGPLADGPVDRWFHRTEPVLRVVGGPLPELPSDNIAGPTILAIDGAGPEQMRALGVAMRHGPSRRFLSGACSVPDLLVVCATQMDDGEIDRAIGDGIASSAFPIHVAFRHARPRAWADACGVRNARVGEGFLLDDGAIRRLDYMGHPPPLIGTRVRWTNAADVWRGAAADVAHMVAALKQNLSTTVRLRTT